MNNNINGLPANISQPLAVRQRLLDSGFEPVVLKGKIPVAKAWQSKEITNATLKVDSLNIVARNTGIRTGSVVALDLDIYDLEHINEFKIMLGKSGIKFSTYLRIGERPKELYVYRLPDGVQLRKMSGKYRIDDERTFGIDLLLKGQQFAAFGKHPATGNDFEWPYDSIIDISPQQLPIITQDQLELIMQCFHSYAEVNEFEPMAGENKQRELTEYNEPNLPPTGTIYNHYPDPIFDKLVAEYGYRQKNNQGWFTGQCIAAHEHSHAGSTADYRPTGVDPLSGEVVEGVYNCHHTHDLNTNHLYAYMRDKHGIDRFADQRKPAQVAIDVRSDYLTFDEIVNDTSSHDGLFGDWMPQIGASTIFGETGSYKSFFVQHLAFHAALGWDFHDMKYNAEDPMQVLYICGEGWNGFKLRARAFKIHNRLTSGSMSKFRARRSSIDMKNDRNGAKLIAEIRAIVDEEMKFEPKLIIIDTLNANFGDGDENKTQDMSAFVVGMDALVQEFNGAVWNIHHPGLQDKKRPRGNGALKNGVETEIMVKGNEVEQRRGDDRKFWFSIEHTKMRDGDYLTSAYKLDVVPTGVYTNAGDERTSLVITGKMDPNEAPSPAKLKAKAADIEFNKIATIVLLAAGWSDKTYMQAMQLDEEREVSVQAIETLLTRHGWDMVDRNERQKFRRTTVTKLTEAGIVTEQIRKSNSPNSPLIALKVRPKLPSMSDMGHLKLNKNGAQ